MYCLELRGDLKKVLSKLKRKDPVQFEAVQRKMQQIVENPYRFKPLHPPMQNKWRVHVRSFVIVYSINEKTKIVIIENYGHHDNIYG